LERLIVGCARLVEPACLGQRKPLVHKGPGELGLERRADGEVASRLEVASLLLSADAEREPRPEAPAVELDRADQQGLRPGPTVPWQEGRSDQHEVAARARVCRLFLLPLPSGLVRQAQRGEVLRAVAMQDRCRARIDFLGTPQPLNAPLESRTLVGL